MSLLRQSVRQYVLTAASVFFVVGCGSRAAGVMGTGGAGGGAGEEEPGAPYTVETFATPLDIIAGTEVSAVCVVSLDREYMPGVATRIGVSPTATMTTTATGATFTPTEAGVYVVRCEIADGGIADPLGVAVNVAAAPPAVVLTTLATNIAQSAAPVHVDCDVEDRYGNPIDLDSQKDVLGIAAPPEILVDPPAGPGFTVRGTLIGDYPIACTFGILIDPIPEMLTIIPGIPADTETIVSDTELTPTETATVSCTVTDEYGNDLTGVPTLVQVMAADGTSPSQNGLTLVGDTVSATTAGTYYVACKVDGYFAADESPAVVTVHPGLPDNWVVDLASQDCFWQDRGLPVLIMVWDQWGNEIDPADYQLNIWATDGTGAPAPGAIVVDPISGAIRIASEGDYIVWIDMDASVQQSATSTITPFSASIRVDSTPPVIDITNPDRGEQLQQSAANVAITGFVSDGTSAIETLMINGNLITVAPGRKTKALNETQVSIWGLNIITGSAVDECGNRRQAAQSYLRSPQYFPADTTGTNTGARATSGLTAHMNQDVLDDRVRGTLANPDADDLGTLAWLILAGMDLNALIPNPIAADDGNSGDGNNTLDTTNCNCVWPIPDITIYSETGYEVWKDGALTYSTPNIDWIYATNDGLLVGLSVSNFDLPLTIRGSFDQGCFLGCVDRWSGAVTISGTVTATSLWADAYLSIPPGSTLNVNCSNCIDMGFSDLTINIDINGIFSFLGGLVNTIINAIMAPFQNEISDLIGALLSGEIGAMVEGFLQDFALATAFSLPPPLSIDLNIASGLDYVNFDGPSMAPPYMSACFPAGSCPTFDGFGEIGLYTQIYPSAVGGSIPLGAPGAIRRRGTTVDIPGSGPTYGSNATYGFGLGLEDDVLNQAMWALWYGGGLELDMGQIMSMSAADCVIDDDCGTGFLCNTSSKCELNGISLTINGLLPPVIMPGSGGNQVYIGLGDAFIDASIDLGSLLGGSPSGLPFDLEMYLSAIIGGRLEIDSASNELYLCLPRSRDPRCPTNLPDALIYVEVTQIQDEGYQALMTDVFTGLMRLLLPDLLGSVVGSFPLPSFDLSGLTDAAGNPLITGPDTVLQLSNASMRRPNMSNKCDAGAEKLDATHLCLTGGLE